MKKKTSRLDEILGYSNRDYDIAEQKSELLFRNKAFLVDYGKLKLHFSIVNRRQKIFESQWKVAGEVPAKVNGHGTHTLVVIDDDAVPGLNEMVLSEFGLKKLPEYKWFFDKWEIQEHWEGWPGSLYFNIQAGPLLWVNGVSILEVADGNPIDGVAFLRLNGMPGWRREAPPPKIYIQVDPWTTGDDIERLCKFLPETKKEFFGFAMESKSCFARDLCWYDLRNELKLKPVEIAGVWAEKRPDELLAVVKKSTDWKKGAEIDSDLSDAKAFVDDYIKTGLPAVVGAALGRLQKAIDYLTR